MVQEKLNEAVMVMNKALQVSDGSTGMTDGDNDARSSKASQS